MSFTGDIKILTRKFHLSIDFVFFSETLFHHRNTLRIQMIHIHNFILSVFLYKLSSRFGKKYPYFVIFTEDLLIFS